jgi:hypothetical protein
MLGTMKTVKTIKEYQLVIDEVRNSKEPVQVKVDMPLEELVKAKSELNLRGVEVIVGNEYDEIKPL